MALGRAAVAAPRPARSTTTPRWPPRATRPTRWCRCSASTRRCSRGGTDPGRARSSCSSACTTSTARCASSAAAGDPRGPARARASGAGPRARRAEVHVTADVGPYARRRDRAVRDALRETDCELVFHPGLFAVDDPAAIRTGQGSPYTVFTPYHRAWSQAPRREVLGKPRALPRSPSQAARRADPVAGQARPRAGCVRSRRGWRARRRASCSARFCQTASADYRDLHDALADRNLEAVALPSLRLPVGARDRGAPARRGRRRRRVSPAAVLAGVLRAGAASFPATRGQSIRTAIGG